VSSSLKLIAGEIYSDSDVKYSSADVLAKNVHGKLTLLSCGAGMGKSTSMKRIAKCLRQRYPHFWTVEQNWTQIQFTIPTSKKMSDQKEAALAFVRDATITNENSNADMLKRVFDVKAGAKEMFVLLDSFDEACPLHRKSSLKLMELLKACGVKMVVATRPQEENEIVKTLQCQRKTVLRLQGFPRDDQTKFLEKYLESRRSYITTETIAGHLQILVKKGALDENVWGIPLNLVMAAEIITNSDISKRISEHQDLYKFFIDATITKTQVEKLNRNLQDARQVRSVRKEADDCRVLLYKLANCLLFNGGKCGDELDEEDRDFLNRFPLATVYGKRVSFTHKTYAEYLMAEAMIMLMFQQPKAPGTALTEDQCLQILVENEFAGVRKFMDKILSHTQFANAVVTRVYKEDSRVVDAMLGEYITADLFHLYKSLSSLEVITPELVNGKRPLGGVLSSPLLQALEHSSNQEFLELLLAQGAEIDAINFDFPFFTNKVLFVDPDDPNIRYGCFTRFPLKDEISLKTPLMRAALNGNCDMARFLLEKGANVNFACAETGATALFFAFKNKHEAMVNFLLQRGAEVTPDALCAAANNGQYDMVLCWSEHIPVDSRNHFNRTALMEASVMSRVAIVDLLMSKGANPLASDNEGRTSLHFAASRRSKKIMQMLLVNVTNVDPRTNTGKTPLHIAVINGNAQIVQILFKNGADILARDENGWNGCHFAAKLKKNISCYFKVFEDCLNRRTNEGMTPLHVAASEGNLDAAKLLVKKGADYSIEDNHGQTCRQLAHVFKRKRLVCFFDSLTRI
jgi:ankyrin repeat protein